MDNSIPPINSTAVENIGLAETEKAPASTGQDLENVKITGALEALAKSSDYSSVLIDTEVNALLGNADTLTDILGSALDFVEA